MSCREEVGVSLVARGISKPQTAHPLIAIGHHLALFEKVTWNIIIQKYKN
jgi:hypothetical protein